MKRTIAVRIVLALGLGLTLAALCLSLNPGSAQSKVPTAELHVCPAGCSYSSVQAAVDAANEGDIIKVATGVYTDISVRASVTQVVYISKSITIQGGYTVTNWTTPYPITQATTLDAQGQGRVMYLAANEVSLSELTVQNGRPVGYADGGGGIYATGTLTLTNVNVFSNTAFMGGGVYALETVAIFGGLFENNLSSNTGGGGLYASRNLTIVGTHFISNTCQGLGGGVLANSRATVEGAYFERNHTPIGSGGGLYAFQRLTLIDTQFISNTGLGGGGVEAMNTVIISGGRFENNHAAWEGGGLYAYRNLILTGTQFIGNISDGNGGGVFIDRGSGESGLDTSRLVNAVFARNSASSNGAALYLFDPAFAGGYAHILHTTIASPTVGAGEAIYVRRGTVGITNSIVTSYSIGIQKSGGAVSEDYNLFFNAPLSGTIGSGGHSLISDPRFVNSIGDDYHLTANSAAIDQGVDTGVTTDIDGDHRPAGAGYDLGADEFYPASALIVTKQADPNLVQTGVPLIYTLRVTNTGSVDLHATITDTLPAHVTPTGILTWTPTITAPGGVWSQTVIVTVEMDYAGPLANTVQATTPEGATGIYTETSTAFVPQPNLQVTKHASPDPVQAGSQLTYTLRVTNTGDVDLHAAITDTLPAHVTPGGTLTWTPTITAPGGVWIQTVVVTVEMGYGGPLTNAVQVTTLEGATGSYTATSQAQEMPMLQVSKQVSSDSVQAGSQLTYTLLVTNTGSMDLHATITDTLPAHVTPTGLLTWMPTITAPGGTWSHQVVVTVEQSYTGTLTNNVQVTTIEGATGSDSVTVHAHGYRIYLPLVLR